jgi:hypothetical protein
MFLRFQTFTAAVLLLIAGAGCKSTETEQEKVVQAEQPPAAVQEQAMTEREYGGGLDIKGPVTETMDVGGYTYLQVDDDEGPTWVAVPQQQVEPGQEVAITEGMEMRNFESKTLNRTFDVIYFTAGFEGESEQVSPHAGIPGAPGVAETAGEEGSAEMDVSPHAGIPGAPEVAGSPGGESFEEALMAESGGGPAMMDPAALSGGSQAARAPAAADVQVEKAEGENAYTVSELFDRKEELNNQSVKVRGKVVKVSTMIMGKNWVHIQDGTRSSAGNNDLVVTTMAEPEKDAVVVVEGTLHADRDFGAGYRYDVIIEDAEIK